MLINNCKFVKLTTLSDIEYNDIHNLYDLCCQYDSYEYYFCTAEEEDADFDIPYDFPLYYLCYDSNLPVSVISVLPDDNSVCLYGLTHPDYRRKHIFTKMLKNVINDLRTFEISSAEIHLCDSKDIPPYIFSILSDNGFQLHQHEYLMEYDFTKKRSKVSQFAVRDLNIPTSDINDDSALILTENQRLLEVEYDEDEQEFSLWIGDNYIGGSHIYISYMPSCEDSDIDSHTNFDEKDSDTGSLNDTNPDSRYPDNGYSDNKYSDNKYPDNKYPDSRYSDNRYSDNRYPDNRYSDNEYSDNRYPDNRNTTDNFSGNNSLRQIDYVTFYGYEILEEYRGKGYGCQGFLLILDMLRSMQVKRMLLHVSGENKTAHNIYTRCGLEIQSSLSVYRLLITDTKELFINYF